MWAFDTAMPRVIRGDHRLARTVLSSVFNEGSHGTGTGDPLPSYVRRFNNGHP